MFSELATYAGTASRWGQRIINSVCVNVEGFELFSFDVSVAFAKGMTFQELSELTGEPVRSVQCELAPEDVTMLRTIPGFEDFDPKTEVLDMLKAIYGLKDAPRAWRKKLHLVLLEFGCQPIYTDQERYVLHVASSQKGKGTLQCILSAHVDDLKGAATRAVAGRLLAHLEKNFGGVALIHARGNRARAVP